MVAGKYRLVQRLARGGMGSVWRAEHLDLQVQVALKFIRNEAEAGGKSADRFRREARLLAQLKSPHIVQVLDFGVDEESPYLAMELLDGSDLALYLEGQRRLSPKEAFPLVIEAARGLQVAHLSGVIHRDVKPSNLFITELGAAPHLKLIDFGIAKEWAGDSNETTQGMVLGSPAYMSPEQARGDRLSALTDVWSLAAVTYRILSGRPPILGKNPNDTVIRICTESPPLLSTHAPELGASFDELFVKAFRRAPSDRHQSVGDFCLDFKEAVRQFAPASAESFRYFGEFDQWLSRASLARGMSGSVGAEGKTNPEGRLEATASLSLRPPSEATELAAQAGQSDGSSGRDSQTASIAVARSTEKTKSGRHRSRSGRSAFWARWAAVGALGVGMWFARSPDGKVEPQLRPGVDLSAPTSETATPVQEPERFLSPRVMPDAAPSSHQSPSIVHEPEAQHRSQRPAASEPSLEPVRMPSSPRPQSQSRAGSKPSTASLDKPSPSPAVSSGSGQDDKSAPKKVQLSDAPPTDPLFGLPLTDP